MADSILNQLKTKCSDLQKLLSQEERRKGREEQLLAQLKSEFNLSTLEEAEALLTKLYKEKEEFDSALVELDTELGEMIASAKGQVNVG
jgi:hypothetical protein